MLEFKKVLFIDDERHIRQANRQTLELADYDVTCLERAEEALPLLQGDWPGIIICDIRLPGMDGLAFLEKVQGIDRDLPVIMITGHGDVSTAVKAMRIGAYDFIEKPYSSERLVKTVQRALEKRGLTLENRSLRTELEAHSAPGPRIIGKTPGIRQLRSTIAQLADTGADVLVVGETGTGKELVARSLHEHSQRRSRNFVAINCGAVPETMIEDELFGHESGAFTGAEGQRIGKFEHANGGTLFLDEIGELPPNLQVKLLRVLQEQEIRPVGSVKTKKIDTRVITATAKDLEEQVAEGNFREDLFYRLNVITLQLPPLRERREDIPYLCSHILTMLNKKMGLQIEDVEPDAMTVLLGREWRGNIRELKNCLERAAIVAETNQITVADLSPGQNRSSCNDPINEIFGTFSLKQGKRIMETKMIRQALETSKGNKSMAARMLEISYPSLLAKIKEYLEK